MKYPFVYALCALLFISSLAAASNELSLQQVLERHTKAIGGANALQAIHSLRLNLHIVEPTFDVRGVYVADRNIHMRIDIMVGGKRVYTEAFDGKTAWKMGEDSVAKEESSEGAVALQNGIFSPDRFFSFEELSHKGSQIESRGRETVNGIDYYVVRVSRNASVMDFYIHPQSWLIELSRETKTIHPDINPSPTTVETVYSDFRKVDGVVSASKDVTTDVNTGKVIQTETVDKIETNIPIDSSFYSKPQ